MKALLPFVIPSLLLTLHAFGETPGDTAIASYFEAETAAIARESLSEIQTKEDWEANKGRYRRELQEMLGLDPLPERTPLKPEVTSVLDEQEFRVENVHFQSMPGVYVTGNLYLPKSLNEPAPTILYVCGHGNEKENGVSLGNKTHYQHHGAWFARNGYVCLMIDTIQLGEIEGIHHGTNRFGMWWWAARGYTPAGVEAWNSIRSLDYLVSRPEVDADRLGVTGRSGGGAYTWWTAALDERVNVAVPVAGITSLKNHVVDGCIEGHCDCMFQVNTYRWDYAKVAALVAPRPLLIANSDKDSIFPLDGVVEVHRGVKRIYELLGAGDQLGLLITEGPHEDTQQLRVPAFHWFNRFLKGQKPSPLIDKPAVPFFEKRELRVFRDGLPADERVTTVQEFFVPQAAEPNVPTSPEEWATLRDAWMKDLQSKVFGGWPKEEVPPTVRSMEDLNGYWVDGQTALPLPLWRVSPTSIEAPTQIILRVLDDKAYHHPDSEPAPAPEGSLVLATAPRGIGPTRFSESDSVMKHLRRRFHLLGQTLDGMRVWDVRQIIRALRTQPQFEGLPITLRAEGSMAAIALYASLFLDKPLAGLDLENVPATHAKAPTFLNILKVLDMPQAIALAAERAPILVKGSDAETLAYARATSKALGWANLK